MFRKINPIVLFALLAILLVAVIFLLRIDARRQQGSFARELVNADISKTTSFVIIHKGMLEDAITLEKNNEQWMVVSHGEKYQANREIIDRIFKMLGPLVPEQLISRDKDSIQQYELTDETGTRVKLYQGKKISDEFVFGKMDFQSQMIQGQQRPKISTYVKLAKQNDIYSVEGYLGSVFPSAAMHYRDQTVINVKENDIEKIKVEGPDFNYELAKEGTLWLMNGVKADSVKMTGFIKSLAMLRSSGFAEQESDGWLTIPSHKIIIERKSDIPIEAVAFPADSTHRYFIKSSQNPDAVFTGSTNNLFEKIYFHKNYFLENPDIQDSL